MTSGEWQRVEEKLAGEHYGWCFHCKQVFPAIDWCWAGWFCPDSDCYGSPRDLRPWSEIMAIYVEKGHVVPAHPDWGEWFLLYPRERRRAP